MGTIQTTNTGTVKFFNEAKNFGFIVDDGKEAKEIFFHVSGTFDRVSKDDKVAFNLETGNRGLKAVDIKRIKDAVKG
jgi:CspA family cold shock protein